MSLFFLEFVSLLDFFQVKSLFLLFCNNFVRLLALNVDLSLHIIKTFIHLFLVIALRFSYFGPLINPFIFGLIQKLVCPSFHLRRI